MRLVLIPQTLYFNANIDYYDYDRATHDNSCCSVWMDSVDTNWQNVM